MKKTQMKFWGGLNTIGGNIIEIRYGNDRIIFDFGRHYNPADVLLSKNARPEKYVSDMLRLNILPKIDGIYKKQDISQIDILSVEESSYNTAVFISHLHLDHVASIDAIHVPIYMSHDSKKMFEQLNKIDELPLKPSNEIKTFDYNDVIEIGEIKLTAYQNDHDIIGSCAFFVETPDLKIGYSGDFRMHGKNPHHNENWMKEMATKKLDYLLIEGTSFFHETEEKIVTLPISELEVHNLIKEKLLEDKYKSGVAFFNIYHRNFDRIEGLVNVAKETKRKIVFEDKTFQLIKGLGKNFDCFKLSTEIKEINKNPNLYLVQNSFDNVFDLLDFNLENSLYIHSNGVPLGEFDPAYNSLLSILEILGVDYAKIQTSGHADKDAILQAIDIVKPNCIIPWHSLAPENINPTDQKILMPQLGIWY